eukprot:TRINITY_DN11831_c0_g1_i1.p1 TRINITY_DN11831_c0_g1~~TRINITY_DN11831_c0_g1_i1.p1  ORF type:complete len:311 (+),score=29.07 TRINITY_DN11831_c0_g1_i1:173-1105(+)
MEISEFAVGVLDASTLSFLHQNGTNIRTLKFGLAHPDPEAVASAVSLCPNVTSLIVSGQQTQGVTLNLSLFASSSLTKLTVVNRRLEWSNCDVADPFPALTEMWLEGVSGSLEAFAMLASRPRMESFVYIGDLDSDRYLPVPFGSRIRTFILNGPIINKALLDLLVPLPNLQEINIAPSRLGGNLSMADFLDRMNPSAKAVVIQSFPIDRAAVSVLQTKLQDLETLVIRYKLESADDVDALMQIPTLTELRLLVDSAELPLDTLKTFANHPRLRIIHVPPSVASIRSDFESRGKRFYIMNERITPFDSTA